MDTRDQERFASFLKEFETYYDLNLTNRIRKIWFKTFAHLTIQQVELGFEKAIQEFPPKRCPSPNQVLHLIDPWQPKAEKEFNHLLRFIAQNTHTAAHITQIGLSPQGELAGVLVGDLKGLQGRSVEDLNSYVRSKFVDYWKQSLDLLQSGIEEPIKKVLPRSPKKKEEQEEAFVTPEMLQQALKERASIAR